ncbi:MAG: class I SAM-dependent methyltransferase [archaeon]
MLKEDDVLELNPEQRAQVIMQWHKNQHKNHEIDFKLTPFGEELKRFEVHEKVWNPEIVSGKYYTNYLFFNNARLFKEKIVLDMGCGSGIMAIVMALFGAKRVVASDISEPAIKNTKSNAKKFGVENSVFPVKGDLFENINEKFDFIAFGHPYFGTNPPKEDPISASMLASGAVLTKFLIEAKKHLKENGLIMLPYYSKAGSTNDPLIQGKKNGYDVTCAFHLKNNTSIQQGEIFVYELKLKNG